jgi:hypothetical protein
MRGLVENGTRILFPMNCAALAKGYGEIGKPVQGLALVVDEALSFMKQANRSGRRDLRRRHQRVEGIGGSNAVCSSSQSADCAFLRRSRPKSLLFSSLVIAANPTLSG